MSAVKSLFKTYIDFKLVKIGAKLLALGSVGYAGYRLLKSQGIIGDSAEESLV